MQSNANTTTIGKLRRLVSGISDGRDYGPLLERIGDARFVLLGEASHGTHEFYRERARITKRLIQEKGFSAVAVEADWPDAYRVNRYVQGASDDARAGDSLSDFKRFPQWMWRNTDVVDFVEWLREHNHGRTAREQKAGFYGLDLYSLYASMEAVVRYLDKIDPEAARRARYRYSCFENFQEDSQAYGYAAGFDMAPSCESEAVAQLVELRQKTAEYARRDGLAALDEFFFAEQNAHLVKNAEEYYRTMFRGRVSSWNLRDRHMSETLEALAAHLGKIRGSEAKIVVWAHNSHLGDARATEMGSGGEWNLGQLTREHHQEAAFLVGFSTYTGTVTAASDWDGPAERKRVRPALSESYEALFHDIGIPQFLALLRNAPETTALLQEPRLERAIGVIYRPQTERLSHYFHANLPQQFDAMIHFDTTEAVRPLDREADWQPGEVWETFPTGV